MTQHTRAANNTSLTFFNPIQFSLPLHTSITCPSGFNFVRADSAVHVSRTIPRRLAHAVQRAAPPGLLRCSFKLFTCSHTHAYTGAKQRICASYPQTNGIHHVLPSFSLLDLSVGQHFKHHLASRPPVPVRGHARAWWRHALAAVVGIIQSRRERFNFRTVISMYVLAGVSLCAASHISLYWTIGVADSQNKQTIVSLVFTPRCQNRRLYVSLYKRVLNSPGTKELKVADKEVLEVRSLAFSAMHHEGLISFMTFFCILC